MNRMQFPLFFIKQSGALEWWGLEKRGSPEFWLRGWVVWRKVLVPRCLYHTMLILSYLWNLENEKKDSYSYSKANCRESQPNVIHHVDNRKQGGSSFHGSLFTLSLATGAGAHLDHVLDFLMSWYLCPASNTVQGAAVWAPSWLTWQPACLRVSPPPSSCIFPLLGQAGATSRWPALCTLAPVPLSQCLRQNGSSESTLPLLL